VTHAEDTHDELSAWWKARYAKLEAENAKLRDAAAAPAPPSAAEAFEFFDFWVEEVGDDSFSLRTTSSEGEEGVAELPAANVPEAARHRLRWGSIGRISVPKPSELRGWKDVAEKAEKRAEQFDEYENIVKTVSSAVSQIAPRAEGTLFERVLVVEKELKVLRVVAHTAEFVATENNNPSTLGLGALVVALAAFRALSPKDDD
jgi:hypothetical protein